MLLFACLLVFGLYFLFLRARPKSRGSENVAVLPGKLPVIGNFYSYIVLKDLYGMVDKIGSYAVDNGDICKYDLLCHSGYVITDPEDASTVLQKCMEKMFLYKLISPLVGSQLVSADVAVWKRNRRILDIAFRPHILDGYIKYFNAQANELVEMFAKEVGKGDVDLMRIIIKNILETTRHTTFGNCNNLSIVKEEYAKSVHKVFEMVPSKIKRPWLLIDFIFNRTSDGREFKKAFNTISQYSRQVVKMRKAEFISQMKCTEETKVDYHQDSSTKFKSCLDIVLEASCGLSGSLLTDEEYRDLLDNVLLAGFDTTINELMFILVCIGTYPEVQEKICEEIMCVMGDEENLRKDHLQKFVYLGAAIKEALRLYPIAPIVARQADTDIELKKITVPRGSSFVINVHAINRHKKHWGPHADDFKPSRWLDSELPSHPAAYCSFAPGRRGCIGRYYAMTHLKATLIPVVRKFKLTSDHKKMKLSWFLMSKPHSGHFIKLESR